MTLAELRDKQRLSRERLAFLTGGMLSASTIYDIERGATIPRLITRQLLAGALGVQVEEIDWPTERIEKKKNSSQSEEAAP